uniref:BHLH domain-containing protein n=1 Tax=Hordeum vulgare subsp. vulgare TaxID=112509 RepID=A0A8I6YD69_HORVV
MDCEAPEHTGVPGAGSDHDNLRALDDYYLTHELLELLLRTDGGGGGDGAGSSVDVFHEKLPMVDHLPLPLPPSSPLPTHFAAGNSSGKAMASDAEMASWLCQVFDQEASDEQEPRSAAIATMKTNYDGGNTSLPSSSYGTGGHHPGISSSGEPTVSLAADGGVECRRGRSSSGRRRSCSGKEAEQRRRDKINDKLKTLQQLTPSCSKTDKASTLEEVIKYVKSLQHQIQMMSAAGYAIPTPFLPLGVMPASCMQLPAGGQAPVMLPQYPVFPAAPYSCLHHGTPLPPLAPCARHPVAGEPRPLAPRRRHLIPNDFTVPSHRKISR